MLTEARFTFLLTRPKLSPTQAAAVREYIRADWQPRYRLYLKSDYWCGVQDTILARSKGTCEYCRTRSASHVHHQSYARLGEELPSDLIHLCLTCHSTWHIAGLQGMASLLVVVPNAPRHKAKSRRPKVSKSAARKYRKRKARIEALEDKWTKGGSWRTSPKRHKTKKKEARSKVIRRRAKQSI